MLLTFYNFFNYHLVLSVRSYIISLYHNFQTSDGSFVQPFFEEVKPKELVEEKVAAVCLYVILELF